MAATLVEILVTVETQAVVETPQPESLTHHQQVAILAVAEPTLAEALTQLKALVEAQVVLETATVRAMAQDKV